MKFIDPRVAASQPIVRIKHIPSHRFLSIYGDESQWNAVDAQLVIKDWDGKFTSDSEENIASSQVWSIVKFRP